MIPQNISFCIGFLCGLMAISSVAHLEAAQETGTANPASTGFVDVDGGKLYYEESNHGGQTVVLIHDGVVDSAVWNDVWPEFCQHFHTVRYDRRGFGKSPGTTSWYSEIDDLTALFQHLHLGHAALLTANPQDMTHEATDMIMASKPAIGRLNEIKVPTLIVTGAADIPEVQAHAGAIEAGIPGARRIVMDGVGHLVYLEKPAEFARLTINFLEMNQVAGTRPEIQNRGD